MTVPEWLQAVVLGVVQGVTEFVPVSSSGHLVLVPYWFGWEKPSLAFDVALHAGTAVAILAYFRAELWGMARGVLTGNRAPDGAAYRRLALLLALASVPVAVLGLVLHSTVEQAFETPPVAAALLVVTAAILVGGERWRLRRVRLATGSLAPTTAASGSPGAPRTPATTPGGRAGAAGRPGHDQEGLHAERAAGVDHADPAGVTLPDMTWRHALAVGFAQVLALFPGISRSGSTITGGLLAGMTRPAATRFAFLLALPALVGAFLVSLPDLAEPGMFSGPEILLGVTVSFASGYLAIALLIRLVARAGLHVFSGYLVVAGAGTLLMYAVVGPR